MLQLLLGLDEHGHDEGIKGFKLSSKLRKLDRELSYSNSSKVLLLSRYIRTQIPHSIEAKDRYILTKTFEAQARQVRTKGIPS